jgi:translation initiation factor eIF-2B subunit epsilon
VHLAHAAAAALAAGGIPEASLGFHEDIVGQFGAGFAWCRQDEPYAWSLLSASTCQPEESCADSAAGDFAKDIANPDDMGFEDLVQQTSDHFKVEVAETFLRCIKEEISHDNAVIELNGLKIAEDRTFADCAR